MKQSHIHLYGITPASAYACSSSYRPTGNPESRSGKHTARGLLKPNHPHHGITYPVTEQWDDCRSGNRYKRKIKKRTNQIPFPYCVGPLHKSYVLVGQFLHYLSKNCFHQKGITKLPESIQREGVFPGQLYKIN